MACGVARSQGVQYELQVHVGTCAVPVELETCTEELCCGDGNTSVEQRQQVNPGRDTRSLQHLLLPLIEYQDVVDDDAVEESQVNTSHTDFRAQLLRQFMGNFRADETLHLGYVSECKEQGEKTYYNPDDSAYDLLKFLDMLPILIQN